MFPRKNGMTPNYQGYQGYGAAQHGQDFVPQKRGGHSDQSVADALMASGMDYSPVQHWTQGAARVAQALVGRRMSDRLGREQAEREQAAEDKQSELMAALMGENPDPKLAAAAQMAPGSVASALIESNFRRPEAPNYGTVTTADGVHAFNKNDPEDIHRLGDAPVRGPLVKNTVIPNGAGETEFQKSRGKAASASIDAIQERGDAAASTLADADMMNTLIDQIDYTGLGGEALLNIQRAGKMVGLDIGDDVAPKEAAKRLTAKLGLALKSDLPGPMSDGDRQFLLSIPPNLGTSREGNKALVFMMKKRAKFASDMQQSLLSANPQTVQEYRDWEQAFRTSNPPLFDENTKADLLAAMGAN